MIVPTENNVEARHLARHLQRSVFIQRSRGVLAPYAAVKQAHDEVRLAAHLRHILLRRAHKVVEAQAAPEVFRKPRRDTRRQHTQHGDAHAAFTNNRIRLPIRFARFYLNRIGAEHRKFTLFHPTIIDRVSRFHIVIAHCCRIIAHIVEHRSASVRCRRVDIIIVVSRWLSLQNIPVVEEQDLVRAHLLSHPFHIGFDARQASYARLTVHKVVRKIVAVHVRCFNNFQTHVLNFCRHFLRCRPRVARADG